MAQAHKNNGKDRQGSGVDVMETCFNYCQPETAFFSSDERRWITKIRKLAESHPEEVRIIRQPDENDGCIYCSLPLRWLYIRPPIKRNLTEEQRLAVRDRFVSGRVRDVTKGN